MTRSAALESLESAIRSVPSVDDGLEPIRANASMRLLATRPAWDTWPGHTLTRMRDTLSKASAYAQAGQARFGERLRIVQAYWAERGAAYLPLSQALRQDPTLARDLCRRAEPPSDPNTPEQALGWLGLLLLTGGGHLHVPGDCAIAGALPPDREQPVGSPFSAFVIDLGPSARLELLEGCARERLITGPLTTRRLLARLAPGARLTRTEVAVRSGAEQHAFATYCLAPGAKLVAHEVWLGTASITSLSEVLAGVETQAHLEVTSVAAGESKHHAHVFAEGLGPGSDRESLDFTLRGRALALGSADSTLSARVENAPRTQADLYARALAKRANARASILAPPEARCTVRERGPEAEAEEAFYLASRGLAPAARGRALAQSTLGSSLAALPDPIAVDLLAALDRLDPFAAG